MNRPFTFTAADITAICNLILVVAAVGALLWNGIKKANAPNKRQDEKIEEIEKKVGRHDEEFKKIKGYLENDKKRLDEIESEIRITNRVIIKTLQVLVRHGIDGNNKQELVDADTDLNEYLLNGRVGHEGKSPKDFERGEG